MRRSVHFCYHSISRRLESNERLEVTLITKSELQFKLKEFVIDERLEEKSKRTIDKYKRDIQKFIDYVDHEQPISKVDTINYKEYLMESDYLPRSINSFIVALNRFLFYCNLGDFKVKKLRLQTSASLEDVINETDYSRLLRWSKKLGYMDTHITMKIIANTGIRIGELKHFTVENIQDFYIDVRNKGKDREIIVPQALARELRSYAKSKGIEKGEIITISQKKIWEQMKATAAAARVNKKKVHAHSFRHYFAKRFMEEYNNVLDLADVLGHNDLKTTQVYTRTTSAEKRKKLEKMSI